jgi:hypothetical protein
VSARELRDSDRGAPDYKPRVNSLSPWLRRLTPATSRTTTQRGPRPVSRRGAVSPAHHPELYDMGRAVEVATRVVRPLHSSRRAARSVGGQKLEEPLQGGVEIQGAELFRADGDSYPAGATSFRRRSCFVRMSRRCSNARTIPCRRVPVVCPKDLTTSPAGRCPRKWEST